MKISTQTSAIPSQTAEATIFRCPPGNLALIEKETGTPACSLCCTTVSSAADDVYEALTDYVGFCRSEKTPLRVDKTKKPLWFEQQGPSESGSEFFDSDSDSKDDDDRQKLIIAKELKEERNKTEIFDRPVFTLGFGQTSVIWPPPKHLSAKSLHEKKSDYVNLVQIKSQIIIHHV